MKTLDELYRQKEYCVKQIRAFRVHGETMGIRSPYQDKFASPEYIADMKDVFAEYDAVMAEIFRRRLPLKGRDHFGRDNVWIWGGPTPSWGGSMAKDAALKAAKYFGFDNVMYVYGPLNEETMELHKGCGKLICSLGQNTRNQGAQVLGDVEEAEELSRLSLTYRNVKGGVIDDMICNYGPKYDMKTYMGVYDALHKHNPELELYGVVYTYELDMPRARDIAMCIDRVILWTWDSSDLPALEMNVEKCREIFPDKKIMMGVFMFDYGLKVFPNAPEAMTYQLLKSKKLLQDGKIEDIVLLGDREIEKCPVIAACIRDFFAGEFSL